MSNKHFFKQTAQAPFGVSQSLGATKGLVWQVIDTCNGELITTSGRLNTTTLNDTITQVIASFQARKADYIFTQQGTVQAILHSDDTYELEP